MALERFSAQHTGIVVDKYASVSSNYAMTTRDYVVRVSAADDLAILLPPVAETAGRFYSILARSVAQGAAVTITHRNDSESWTDIVLDAAGEAALLYSDGLKWYSIA